MSVWENIQSVMNRQISCLNITKFISYQVAALLIISNDIIVIILYHYGKIINNPENLFYLLKGKYEYKIYRTCRNKNEGERRFIQRSTSNY